MLEKCLMNIVRVQIIIVEQRFIPKTINFSIVLSEINIKRKKYNILIKEGVEIHLNL